MSPRASSLLLGGGLALLAAATAGIAASGLAEGWRAYAGAAAVVVVRHGAAAGIAAAAALALLAAMLLPAAPSPRYARGLFRAVIVCLAGAAVLPGVLALVSRDVLERQGYRACPPDAASAGQRFLATRWCRETGPAGPG